MSDTSMVVNHQWSKRPDDERYTSLTALAAQRRYLRQRSRPETFPNRKITVLPSATDPFDVAVTGPAGVPAQFTHWSFGQLAGLAGVPAGYLRDGLPGALIADNMNWGLHHRRSVEELGVLLRKPNGDGMATFAATTGPKFGRVWDCDVCDELVDMFGDGVTGDFKVPGEFGRDVPITKDNTTIYGSDRDMWLFLADEKNRIEIPNRRSGSSGSAAIGFYNTNSEVGGGVLGFGMFAFDYLCCNRIMWGVSEKHEIRIRHTAGAPMRWDEEVKPILLQLANADVRKPLAETIKLAQAAKIKGDVETFLASRFGKGMVAPIMTAHQVEELRPIETLWDTVTAATAYARLIPHQDSRVAVEREAGKLLKLAA